MTAGSSQASGARLLNRGALHFGAHRARGRLDANRHVAEFLRLASSTRALLRLGCPALVIWANVALARPSVTYAARPAGSGYIHETTWQARPTPPLGVIVDPVRLYTASDGTVFVTDRALHRAQRFSPSGEPLADYGHGRGILPGQHMYPLGAAADIARNRVYVLDSENTRVSVWTLDGTFVATWPVPASPLDAEIARDGRVVISAGTTSILILDVEGRLQKRVEVGIFPQDESLGVTRAGIALEDDVVYVPQAEGVTRLRLDGTVIGPVPRFKPQQPPPLREVAFDGSGRMFVFHGRNWVTRERSTDFFREPMGGTITGAATGPGRTLYVAYAGTADKRASVAAAAFTANEIEVTHWGDPLTILGWLFNPVRITAGADGDVYIVDELYRVQHFAPDGTALGQLSLPGLREADASSTGDVFVARQRSGSSDETVGDPEVPESGTHRLIVECYRFPTGFVSGRKESTPAQIAWSRSWLESRQDHHEVTRFAAMEFDAPRDMLYVLDAGQRRILRFTAAGAEQPALALPKLRAGFPEYTDLAVAPDGSLYALHTAGRRAYRFAPGSSQPEPLPMPAGAWRLDLTPSGSLATITSHGWSWIIDPSVRVESVQPIPVAAYSIGEPPSDVAVRADGRMYVTDRSGAAVMVMAPGEGEDFVPPGSDLTCSPQIEPQVEPRELAVGSQVEVRLVLGGACDLQPRSHEPPLMLLATGTVSVTLPAGLRVVPGSLEPAGAADRHQITWNLAGVGLEGLTLRYRAVATATGRLPAFQALGGTYMDGWYAFGTFGSVSPYIVARGGGSRPPVPGEIRLFLPGLLNRLAN